MAKEKIQNWNEQGLKVNENTIQARRANGETITQFYGLHEFKVGQTAKLRNANGFDFPAIGELSAEKLVNLGVAEIVFNDDKTLYQYVVTKNCTVKVENGGVEEFVRKGQVEKRNKTIYSLV